MSGEARDSVRQSARPVIELDFGILVYPPETGGEPWRAVFTENGQREYRQGATEAKLAESWSAHAGCWGSLPPRTGTTCSGTWCRPG